MIINEKQIGKKSKSTQINTRLILIRKRILFEVYRRL